MSYLSQMVEQAAAIRTSIYQHYEGIWPGFKPFPFMLYDDHYQVASGDGWPEPFRLAQEDIWTAERFDAHLMGCTTIGYHDRQIAIWDTRTWPDQIDTAAAAAMLAHEMFHAYQMTVMGLSWANELLLPCYPHTSASMGLVMEENHHLTALLQTREPEALRAALRALIALRKRRAADMGESFMAYDHNVESTEGTAAYVEIHMKAAVAQKDTLETAKKYLTILQEPNNLLHHYRHRCYVSGLALCLAADTLKPGWQCLWQAQKQPLLQWLAEELEISPPALLSLPAREAAAALLNGYEKEKESKINTFMSLSPVMLEGDIQLTGFDPMNLTCVKNLCLHRYGRLRINGREYMLEPSEPSQETNGTFLCEFAENILNVKKLWVSAPAAEKIYTREA